MKPDKSAQKEQIGFIIWFLLLINLLFVFFALIIGNITDHVMSIKGHLVLIIIITLMGVLVLTAFIGLNHLWKFLDERPNKVK